MYSICFQEQQLKIQIDTIELSINHSIPSTTDQIFTMRQILEKMAEYRHDTYHLFIDFKAAYDSIARVKLYDAMSSFGIPAKLIRLVRMTMTNVTCQVRVDGKLSGPFAATKGLCQRDVDSFSNWS